MPLGNKATKTKPKTTQQKPNPTKPKQGQAYSLSACGTTGRTHLGGNENGELPHRPIQRGGAVRQEYARASQDKKKNNPTKPTTNQTNQQAPEGIANSLRTQNYTALRRECVVGLSCQWPCQGGEPGRQSQLNQVIDDGVNLNSGSTERPPLA